MTFHSDPALFANVGAESVARVQSAALDGIWHGTWQDDSFHALTLRELELLDQVIALIDAHMTAPIDGDRAEPLDLRTSFFRAVLEGRIEPGFDLGRPATFSGALKSRTGQLRSRWNPDVLREAMAIAAARAMNERIDACQADRTPPAIRGRREAI